MHSKKRLIRLVFIVAAAMVALAYVLQGVAAARNVFDGTALAGYKYSTTTGDQFYIVSVAPLSKIAIDLPGESLIVENQTCSFGRKFEVCYNGASFKGYNTSLADRVVYEFRIKVSLVAPEIQVAKSLDKARLDVGESTVVNVNITNIGTAKGTVRLTDSVPARLRITELPGQPCELSPNNAFRMVADLKGGEMISCSYKVTALEPGTYGLVSAVSYEVINTETATATATLSVNGLPFSVVENISNSLLLGSFLNISLLLSPSANLSSFVFKASVPGTVRVFSVNKEAALERDSGSAIVAYGGRLAILDSDVRINISSELAYAGTSVISANSSWIYNGLEQNLVKNILVNATLGRPYLRATKYDNETGKVSLEAVNPAHLSILDVAVIPQGPAKATFSAAEIGSLSHASFSDTPTQLPGFNSAEARYTGKIVYHTGYGQELSEPFSLSFNVSGAMPAVANDTNITVAVPASPSSQGNSTQAEQAGIVKKPKPQPKSLTPAEVGTAMVMVGIIIAIIVFFFAMKGRERGVAEETNPNELR